MKIEVSSKVISEALKNLQSVSTNGVDTLIIEGVAKDKLAITAYDNDREAVAYVDAKVSGKDIFYVHPDVFTPLVKNRGDLVLTFEGSLNVSQVKGSYKVEGVPLKGGARRTPVFPKSEISEELSSKIQNAISKTLIKQVTTEDIFFGMGLYEDTLVVGVVDQFHAAISEIRLSPKELKQVAGFNNLIIPLSYAELIPKIPGNMSINISDNSVTYFSDSFLVNLPSLAIKPVDIVAIHKDLTPIFKGKSQIDIDHIKNFMSNIGSVMDPLVSVDMHIKNGNVKMEYRTTKGIFTDSCPCKTEKSAHLKVDPFNMNDSIKKASGPAKIGWNDYGLGFLKIEEGSRTAYFSNIRT